MSDESQSVRLSKADWLILGQRLLSEEGPSGLGIDRLTQAAGRTKGSFYHHFQGRDDFLTALMAHWREVVMEIAAQPFRDDPTPEGWRKLLHDAPLRMNHAFERA